MIQVIKTVTATNADMLAATDLANIPRGGQLSFSLTDDAGTSTIQVLGPGTEPSINNIKSQKRTNGQPILSDEPLTLLPVTLGGHYTVNFTLGAGGTTATMIATFESDAEIVARAAIGG